MSLKYSFPRAPRSIATPPKMQNNKDSQSRKVSTSKKQTNASKRVNVDIVTGKELISVYFDPTKVVGNDANARGPEWIGLNLYAPATVVKEENGIFTVRLPGGEVMKMSDPIKISDNDDEGLEDILKLKDFSEMSLLHTLRQRYTREEIYTFVGSILISINPYKRIPALYDDATMGNYHNRKQGELSPHLFVIAENSYHNLMESVIISKPMSQSIIISGESGAGKTEATKLIMSYLARITMFDKSTRSLPNSPQSKGINLASASRDKDTHQQFLGELEQKVLNTNPILESFGNARTLRNDNSSRFGKFIKIHFSEHGKIVGASIEKYLLEKTRLIHQIPGERNFHIFYQLLRSNNEILLNSLYLTPNAVESYHYISNSVESSQIPNVSDAMEFEKVCSCLNLVCDDTLQFKIFQILAGILHLGNVYFMDNADPDSNGVQENILSIEEGNSTNAFEKACLLLGFEKEELFNSLTKQNMYVNNNIIVKVQTLSQAIDKKHSFAKHVYSSLFSWLIDKLNSTITVSNKNSWGFIGLLDIYGFENFENMNSFEQLLINYANEKMQNHFNKHIFQMEQQEYELESIDWSYIKFYDNQPCVDLIDGKPFGKSGILQTLDDSSNSGRSEANASFLASVNMAWSGQANQNSKHPNFVAPRFNSDQKFGILHYAGEVFYEIQGFVEKNREAINNDLKDLMTKSTNDLLKTISEEMIANEAAAAVNASMTSTSSSNFPSTPSASSKNKNLNRGGSFTLGNSSASSTAIAPKTPLRGSVSKLKEDSISKQFVNSLKCLFDTLENTQPHFIRCIKPNAYKKPDLFNGQDTLLQLKYSGMLETIKIRQQGYALRIEHKEFFDKYHHLIPTSTTLKELVNKLSKELQVKNESWQVGTTKLFIKRDLAEKLDRLLWLCYSMSCRKIKKFFTLLKMKKTATYLQARIRSFLARKHFMKFRRAMIVLQSTLRRKIQKRSFQKVVRSIIFIQKIIRSTLARMIYRKLKNPYNHMNYDELMENYRRITMELNLAFQQQDFRTCSILENEIISIKTIQDILVVPKRSPSSREELNLFIMEASIALESAGKASDIKTVSYYEELIASYQSMKNNFPTMEEIQENLNTTNNELKIAMKQKQFKLCSDLQNKISSLENTLKMMKEENATKMIGIPLNELKEKKMNLETSLTNELEKKNFDLCTSLQQELDILEGIISKRDLSKDDLEGKLNEIMKEMEKAKEIKDFLNMAKFQLEYNDFKLQLDQLLSPPVAPVASSSAAPAAQQATAAPVATPAPVVAPAAAPVSKKNRKELLEAKAEKEKELQVALKQKNYALCEKINKDIEDLKQEIDKIPTYSTVCAKLVELDKQLKTLIASKKYGECESVEKEIAHWTELKNELKDAGDSVGDMDNAEEDGTDETEQDNNNQKNNKKKIAVAGAPVVKSAENVLGPSKGPKVAGVSSSVAGTDKKSKQSNDKENVAVKGKGVNSTEESKPADKTKTEKTRAYDKPVSKLRPKAPITASAACTIYEVATKMANNRVDAALLLDEDGGVAGIITDNDITRKVVSQSLDVNEALVENVMTKNPKCVSSDDSALDAFEMMVDNRFRHLPVLDKDGAVVGLLDIAKCMYDAISILEKVQEKEEKADNGAVLAEVMSAAMKNMGGKGNNAAQLMAMKALMENMFGGSVPTLRKVLDSLEKVPTVSPSATVREASKIMAQYRKGILVMEKKGKDLLGIFTPKDLLSRVISKGLSPDETLVSAVMTPNPDCVSSELTILDALKEMHDHKYLHLPVREENGKVLGVVDVMDLITHSAGAGVNGKGWRDFFNRAMAAKGDRDTSDAGSDYSKRSKAKSANKEFERPVSKLRPKAPITAAAGSTIYEVAAKMTSNRVDAALLLDDEGMLAGIITDNDITRRVVSQSVDVNESLAENVMTKNPKCVSSEDSALDALEMMVDNRFRHLPVLDKDGAVVGLLDIAKCMYDAISILEKVQEKEEKADNGAVLAEVMSAAMKNMGGKGNNAAQLMAMKALMENMFGGSVPTLRKVLDSSEKVPTVTPNSTVREASKIMAQYRKGILVMEKKGKDLLGIFTPKDLLSRVISKGLSPDETLVSAVMTPNPDCVSSELTILDALKEMHDHKYLHLPVREENGKVLGVVDVMDLITHSANGGKGWRDFFNQAMAAKGDQESSDVGSDYSKRSKGKSAKEFERPVSKLRPKAPVTAAAAASIFEVASKMTSNRVDAALLLDEEGVLAGIITDNDITRRVVSQSVDVNESRAENVMTKNPKCVSSEDSALDALEMMVDNRFRHLPVLDKDGAVVGLLDIAKCMYDAISILEKVQEKEEKADNGAVLAEVMSAAMKNMGGKGNNAAQLMAMKALMENMFGGSVPTLRKVLDSLEKVPTVSPSATVREASKIMAQYRKGILVMEKKGKDLLGIFTPKDLLSRVISKGLSPDETLVSAVMTPNPDCVSSELTILDALKEMHDHKYLHLPVREENGKVLGVVDVMDLITHSAGGDGSAGGKGWRDFFRGAMNARGEHESSDAGSDKSGGSKRSKLTANKEHERPVSKLRPKVPITLSASNTIYEVATKMTGGRVDAALLLDEAGVLAGIITDNDITRRVISQFVDANEVKVDAVMTKDPKCVHADDPALDALEMMVDNKFRHLPVLDKEGAVVGLLDIAKCLYDAISILEKVQEKDSNKSIDSGNALAEVMTAAMKNMGGSRGNNAAQLLAMKALMENMFGGSVPTLRDIIGDAGYPSVRRTVNVREAAVLMTKHRKGLLVEDNDGEVCGIITPKDIMNRVLSQNKSPDLTAVATVMTPNPDFVTPDYTILEALKEMHDQKYLHLPVRESNGVVVGLVDVMELITHSAGDGKNGKGWRDFFKGAMAARANNNDGKDSDVLSSHSHHSDIDYKATPAPIRTRYQQQQQQLHAQDSSSDVFSIPNENMKIPSHSASQDYTHHSHLPHIPIPTAATSSHEEISFKITDENKNIHKIKLIPNSNTIELLKEIISEKVSIPKDLLIIKYIDEENDEILLNSNKLLDEAIQLAKKLKLNSVRLIVQEQHNQIKSIRSTSSAPLPTNVMAAAPVIPSVPSSPMKSIREENANNYQQNDENVVNALPTMEESSGELKPAKTLQEMIDPNNPPDNNNKNEEAPANPNPNPSGGGGWLLYGGSAIAAGAIIVFLIYRFKKQQ